MKTTTFDRSETDANERWVADAAWRGLDTAAGYARVGRLISAIKHLELVNPGMTREEAKAFVHALGYGRELRWPEPEKLPVRRL